MRRTETLPPKYAFGEINPHISVGVRPKKMTGTKTDVRQPHMY